MEASGTFEVTSFVAAELTVEPAIETGVPVGVTTMVKQFDGDMVGRSATVFTSAFDQTAGIGTYVAMESFEGALHSRSGTFNFMHSATMTGTNRESEFFVIVPGSGTGDLAGIAGAGSISVDSNGTHRIRLDYTVV